MKNIIAKQKELQKLIFGDRVTSINPLIDNCNVGFKYDGINQLSFFMHEEITELMEALGNSTRDTHKPWRKSCHILRKQSYASTDEIKEEAIDMLCFALNICLAVGIDENNIDDTYEKVCVKIKKRLKGEL